MNREERQRADRERKRRQRREQGMKTREEYLAGALSVTRPWKAEGISRRSWYRRRADRPVPDRPVTSFEKALKLKQVAKQQVNDELETIQREIALSQVRNAHRRFFRYPQKLPI